MTSSLTGSTSASIEFYSIKFCSIQMRLNSIISMPPTLACRNSSFWCKNYFQDDLKPFGGHSRYILFHFILFHFKIYYIELINEHDYMVNSIQYEKSASCCPQFYDHLLIIHFQKLWRCKNGDICKIHWKSFILKCQYCFANISATKAPIFMKFKR